MRDRAIGALVGLAVGDAVGTTLEFRSPGTFEPITDMVGGGPFNLPAGAWTDDTSMAMCLAESILDTGRLDPADQLRHYVAWWREGYWSSTGRCFDIGSTTSRALYCFETTGEVADAQPNENNASNGSLMRLAPVAIRWFPELFEAAERSGESSLTTHASSRAVDACRALGAMIAAFIYGSPVEEAFDQGFAFGAPRHPELKHVLLGSARDRQPPEIRGTGYAVEALEAAMWAVGGAADIRDAILRAVNHGDVADTTGAIAGQLAGARWGLSAIPAEWRDRIVGRTRIEAIAGRLFDAASWDAPPPLWQFEDAVHAYWVEPGAILAGEYPGHLDEERALQKLNLLIDHGVRTFVDLTTAADGMEPYANHLTSIAERRGMQLQHVTHPIPDMGVISNEGYTEITRTLRDATDRGGVYVHCWGGVGRTGTVVGCLLVDSGISADAALAQIDTWRSVTHKAHMPAPQTAAQIDVIRRH
ncbi:MAG: ADP-ribosylglycohydrolase family protein [Acidimicrobiia bacterium]